MLRKHKAMGGGGGGAPLPLSLVFPKYILDLFHNVIHDTHSVGNAQTVREFECSIKENAQISDVVVVVVFPVAPSGWRWGLAIG